MTGQVLPLSTLCQVSPRDPALPETAPFVPMNAVEAGARYPVRYEERGVRGGVRARAGDVLFARITPCLENGKVAQVPLDSTAVGASTEFIVIRPGPTIDPGYLFYWCLEPRIRAAAQSQMTGVTGRMRLAPKALGSLDVPVRSLAEQRRIVEILEDHLSRLDAAAKYALMAASRLENLQLAGFDKLVDIAVTGEGPEGRAIRSGPLVDFTDAERPIRYGILKPQELGPGTVPYVEVRDLRSVTLERDRLKRTARELDERFAGARLQRGDVVIAVRGSYERCAVVPAALNGCNISRDVARIAPLPTVDPSYLHLWLQTSASKKYLHSHARGVAVRGVNIASLRSMPIVVPELGSQRAAARGAADLVDGLRRLRIQCDTALRRGQALRRAVLAAAFSGRLTGGRTDEEVIEEMTEADG